MEKTLHLSKPLLVITAAQEVTHTACALPAHNLYTKLHPYFQVHQSLSRSKAERSNSHFKPGHDSSFLLELTRNHFMLLGHTESLSFIANTFKEMSCFSTATVFTLAQDVTTYREERNTNVLAGNLLQNIVTNEKYRLPLLRE